MRASVWLVAAFTLICTHGAAASLQIPGAAVEESEKLPPCDEDRVSYLPLDGDLAAQIKESFHLEVVKPEAVRSVLEKHKDRSNSPNKKRWASIWRDHPVGVNSGWTEIAVERAPNDLLVVRLRDVYQDAVTFKWISKKLLFVEAWWGRIAATEMILDVEKGSWVYQELAYYNGAIHCAQMRDAAVR